MEVHVHVYELLGFIDLEPLGRLFLLDGVLVDFLLEQFLDLLDHMHTALFTSGFASPDEDLPEKHFLSSASDMLGVLEPFM